MKEVCGNCKYNKRHLDEGLHKFFAEIKNKNIKWNSFLPSWFDEYERENECLDYYDYYYAEDELYIIRNRLNCEIWFTKAKSPYEAYMNHSRHLAECYGHTFRGRDFSFEDYYKEFCCNCQCFEDCDHIPIMKDGSIMGDFRYDCRGFEDAELDLEF